MLTGCGGGRGVVEMLSSCGVCTFHFNLWEVGDFIGLRVPFRYKTSQPFASLFFQLWALNTGPLGPELETPELAGPEFSGI